jgi:hypothetical protein
MASDSDITSPPATPPIGTNVTEESSSPLFTPEINADDANTREDSPDSEREDNILRRRRAPDPNKGTLNRDDSFPLPVIEAGRTMFVLEPGCAHIGPRVASLTDAARAGGNAMANIWGEENLDRNMCSFHGGFQWIIHKW